MDASIERLYAASFEFRIPDVLTGMSRLLLSVTRREDSAHRAHDYEVLLDIRLAQLFNQEQWTILRKSERDLLAGDPVAKGLYAYYSTHSTPYPTKVSTLKTLMGRETMQDSKWRTVLQASLAKLQAVTGWYQCEIARTGAHAGKALVVKTNPLKDKDRKSTGKTSIGRNADAFSVGWDAIQSDDDLKRLPLDALIGLMDSRAKQQWHALLDRPGPEPSPEFTHQTAMAMLVRQWYAIQLQRDPSSDPDGEI